MNKQNHILVIPSKSVLPMEIRSQQLAYNVPNIISTIKLILKSTFSLYLDVYFDTQIINAIWNSQNKLLIFFSGASVLQILTLRTVQTLASGFTCSASCQSAGLLLLASQALCSTFKSSKCFLNTLNHNENSIY